jgi:hypothetical protein
MAISEKQRQTVLQCLEQGMALRQACKEADIPEPSRVLDIVRSDATFAAQYTRAREIGYTLLGDDLQQVSDDTSIPADHRRIMVDTRKWMLSKMLPKIYGDRLDLNHSGSVSTQNLTRAELMAIAAQGKTQGGDAAEAQGEGSE